MDSINIQLKSSWASLSDYVSADAYNKLKEDVLAVAKARGMITEDNINTFTNKTVNSPTDKIAGEIVKISDIIELQNIARGTIGYEGLCKDYNFKNPSNLSKPLALLYNEVRQVVVDSYAGAGCANSCSTACKSSCSTNCYTACTTECLNDSCESYCFSTCSSGCLNSGCKDDCITNCTTSNCTYESNDSCGVELCRNNCSDSCSINSCAQDCAIACFKTCYSDCGTTCQHSVSCSGTCFMECSNGCGTDSACSSLVTGSNPYIEDKRMNLSSINKSEKSVISYTDGSNTFIKKLM